MPPFRKSQPGAPPGYFAWEATGLQWLGEAQADGGVPVARVLDVGPTHLDLDRPQPVPPTRAAAAQFGERLARTHATPVPHVVQPGHGAGPPGWRGDGYFGPTADPRPLSLTPHCTWAEFYAAERLTPVARLCRDAGVFSATDVALLDRVAARLTDLDPQESPSRIHGDLWSGNILWTANGATLIDAAAHHGHRETDLAMLALFGAPHLEVTLTAYQSVRPLADGWRGRVALHQLYPLAVHALLFGGGYAAQTLAAARHYA